MKKTQRLDARKNIQKRIVSFLSICIIVMFGIGGTFATRYIGEGFKKGPADFYREYNFKDFEVLSSLGITPGDIDALKKVDGVGEVEGLYSFTGALVKDDIIQNIHIISETTKINKLKILEGSNPQTSNECVILDDLADSTGLTIGDTIHLSVSGKFEVSPLKEEAFTICGIGVHPEYNRRDITYVVVLNKNAFNQDALHNAYTSALIRSTSEIDMNIYDYMDTKEGIQLQENLRDTTYALKADTIQYFKDIANEEIDKKWDEAQQLLQDGENEINQKEDELNTTIQEARDAIQKGRNELDNALKELQNAENTIASSETQLNDAKQLIAFGDEIFKNISPDEALVLLNTLSERIDALSNMLSSDDKENIENTKQEVITLLQSNQAKTILNQISTYTEVPPVNEIITLLDETSISRAKNAISSATTFVENYIYYKPLIPSLEQQLTDAKKSLDDGYTKYNAGLQEINTKENELNQKEADARKQIQDAKDELENKRQEAIQVKEDALKEVEKIDGNLVVQTRSTNHGFMECKSSGDGIQSAGNIFGLLFLLVGALVCFSTITIIVEEEKKIVGTTKAFGFRNHEILAKYLSFGVISSIIGSILGVLLAYTLGYFVLKKVGSLELYYSSAPLPVVNIKETLIVCIGAVLLCALVTIISCLQLLKSPASLLLKGETLASRNAKLKKRKDANHKGSLYSHLILRNILDDKARVIISILIVALSVVIIGAGSSIKRAVAGMFEHQMNDIYHYTARIDYTKNLSEEDIQKVKQILDDKGIRYLQSRYETRLIADKNSIDAVYLLCANPSDLKDYVTLNDINTKQLIDMKDDGIYVQRKLAENRGFQKGYEITLLDNTLDHKKITVEGVFENYFGRIVIVSPNTYQKLFNQEVENNCFYILKDGLDTNALKDEIHKVSTEISFEIPHDTVYRAKEATNLYDIIMIVLTAMAVMMSFMILTNLANIYVTRKKKELIVMRINGFSIKQTINYLAKETIFTTLFALVIGTLIGMPISRYAIMIMEQPDIQFARDISIFVWIFAIILEGLLAFAINYFTFRKVKDLNFREL